MRRNCQKPKHFLCVFHPFGQVCGTSMVFTLHYVSLREIRVNVDQTGGALLVMCIISYMYHIISSLDIVGAWHGHVMERTGVGGGGVSTSMLVRWMLDSWNRTCFVGYTSIYMIDGAWHGCVAEGTLVWAVLTVFGCSKLLEQRCCRLCLVHGQ